MASEKQLHSTRDQPAGSENINWGNLPCGQPDCPQPRRLLPALEDKHAESSAGFLLAKRHLAGQRERARTDPVCCGSEPAPAPVGLTRAPGMRIWPPTLLRPSTPLGCFRILLSACSLLQVKCYFFVLFFLFLNRSVAAFVASPAFPCASVATHPLLEPLMVDEVISGHEMLCVSDNVF